MFEAYICDHEMKAKVPPLAGFVAAEDSGTAPESLLEVSSESVYCITTLGRSH